MSVYESPKVTRFLNWPGLGPTARVDVAKDKYATNVVKVFLVIVFDEFVDLLLLVSRSSYTFTSNFVRAPTLHIVQPKVSSRLTCSLFPLFQRLTLKYF